VHFRVRNGGHTWPGSELPGMVTSLDFHASTVIWQFFDHQSLPGLSVLSDNTKNLELSAYPNPADDELTLSFKEHGTYHISLFTMTGSKMYETSVSQRLAQIKLDNFRPGMYKLLIKSDSKYASLKFVKL
jgi:hypothetical protein